MYNLNTIMDPSDIRFGFYMYESKVTNLFYHWPALT